MEEETGVSRETINKQKIGIGVRVRLFNVTPCPTLPTEMHSKKHSNQLVSPISIRRSNLGVLEPDRDGVVRFCLRISR